METSIAQMQTTDLQGIILFPLHDIEQECSNYIKALAVANALVPSSVGQQHTF